MSTALPWLPVSSSSPLLSSLPRPAPNTTIPKDRAAVSQAIGFQRLKPYINASRFHKQQPGERRAKEIYRDTPLLEQSKTILVHLGWALPAQSFQTSIQFPGSQAERREEVLLRCECVSKLQTLLRSRAKQQGRTSKNGSVTRKNDSKCKPTISPPYRDKSEKILFRQLLQTFPWQTSEHYPSARQRHNYNTLMRCSPMLTRGTL
jgi:hypothetical protein